MQSRTQGSGGPDEYFLWEPAGKPISIYLSLDVVDRLLPEIMRGFGAVPKRGAEIGGFLLGRILEQNGRTVVQITDFELVACEYRRGPSFLLSENDLAAYEEAYESYDLNAGGPIPVAYFRSHTREGLQLSDEDVNLCAGFFPAPHRVALLVKPYATRISTASFFCYEGEELERQADHEFPFRRKELQAAATAGPGGVALTRIPARVPAQRPAVAQTTLSQEPVAPEHKEEIEHPAQVESRFEPAFEPAEVEPPRFSLLGAKHAEPTQKRNWTWLPVSILLLAAGAAGGYYGATQWAPPVAGANQYALKLEAKPAGENLQIRWDRAAQPVAAASSGSLEIEDGPTRKTIDLDKAMLENGSLLYRNSSPTIRARLRVRIGSAGEVAEAFTWTAPNR